MILINEFISKVEDFITNPDAVDTAVFAMSLENFLYGNEESIVKENKAVAEFLIKEFYWPLADANSENTEWFISELNRLIPQVRSLLNN